MDSNQRKILEMLADKKITVEEAERLMSLLHTESGPEETRQAKETKNRLRYLRIEVKPGPHCMAEEQENVNIRVPFALIRAGMKLGAVIPPSAYDQVNSAMKDKGIEFDLRNIKAENLEEVLANLNDLEVDVHNGKQTLHIYAE